MASSSSSRHLLLLHLFFSLLLTIKHLSVAQTTIFHGGFLLDITKDPQTLQHTAHLLIGTPPLSTKLVVHLSGKSLWLNCAQSSSSSRQLVRHGSLSCLMAKPGAKRLIAPTPTICEIHQENPITRSANFGDLAEDIVSMGSPATVDGRFLFSCSPEYLLNGLAAGAKGVLGLGRSKIAFQSQAVNNFDIPRKFTVCLSSSDGFILSGSSSSISKSLSYTPLKISTNSQDDDDGYYVNVKSIKINGRRLALHDGGPVVVEVSTVVPYTTMKTPIYAIFTKAYLNAARSMNMTSVAPVGPFGVCFRSQQTTAVPEIELALQSEMVKWRIQRRNSMVQVSDSVMCLGFVDGGLDMIGGGGSSVVLGAYQLEDHILEFNLGTGMMGFSRSSLMEDGNSCSKMKRSILAAESVSYSNII